MKINKWTLGLAAVGLVTLPAGLQAEEQMQSVATSLSSTTISGYVNTGAQWDIGTGNGNPPGYSFNSNGKQDGFSLNVVKISIERPLDEAEWAAGYKVDLLFGEDANVLGAQSVLSDGATDLGIQQAYVALRAPTGNGLDFKVGVFDTIIGYEVFDAGGNPNYSRSWGYTIEPTTHTGVLASYQVNDYIAASAGIANTYGPTINDRPFGTTSGNDKAESYKTYMGSVALTAPEDWGFLSGSTLYAGVVNGFGSGAQENVTSIYVGTAMATPIKGLVAGTAHDWQLLHDTPPGGGGKHAYAHGLYLSFQATEKLSLHGRVEYAKFSAASVGTLYPGVNEKVLGLTGTVQYDLWQNVLSRLEIRWDHQMSGSGDAFGGDIGDAPSDKDHVTVAGNIIYQF